MLVYNEEYQEKNTASKREFQSVFVSMHFAEEVTLFDLNRIKGYKLLEEAFADNGTPFGGVSSNEFVVTLDNSDNAFTPEHPNQIYEVKPGMRVEAVAYASEGSATIELGTYYTGEWTRQGTDISVTCYDSLQATLSRTTMELTPAYPSTTTTHMLTKLFDGLGIEEYYIDEEIARPLRFGWLRAGTFERSLQELCEASRAFAFIDRFGVLKVVPFKAGEEVLTITDDDMFNLNIPQRILDTHTRARVGYRLMYIKQPREALRIDEIRIPAGISEQVIELGSEDIPMLEIQNITVDTDDTVTIQSYQYGASMIKVKFNNTGGSKTIALLINGISGGSHTSSVTATNNIELYGDRELTVFNPNIQDRETATSYANELVAYTSDALVRIEVEFRGDLALELGDTVRIQSTRWQTDLKGIVVRIEHDFDGSLSGRLVLTRVREVVS